MLPDFMGIEFTPAELTTINLHADGLITLINAKKSVQLSDTERQGTASVSDERYPFVGDTFNSLAPLYPNIQPPFKVFADEQKNFNYLNQHRIIAEKIKKINDIFGDHSIAAEYFAYKYMREFYDIAKLGVQNNVPGADVVVQRLSPLFEKQGSNQPVAGGGTTPVTPT